MTTYHMIGFLHPTRRPKRVELLGCALLEPVFCANGAENAPLWVQQSDAADNIQDFLRLWEGQRKEVFSLPEGFGPVDREKDGPMVYGVVAGETPLFDTKAGLKQKLTTEYGPALADLPGSSVERVEYMELLGLMDGREKAILAGYEEFRQILDEDEAKSWRDWCLSRLQQNRTEGFKGSPTPWRGWHEISTSFLDGLVPPKPEDIKRFFVIGAPSWKFAKLDDLPRRLLVKQLKEKILAANTQAAPAQPQKKKTEIVGGLEQLAEVYKRDHPPSPVFLVQGASGEGKTFALMQLGVDLAGQGMKVYFGNAANGQNSPLDNKPTQADGPSVLLVDEADQLTDPVGFLRKAQAQKPPAVVVLAARFTEWNDAQERWRRSGNYFAREYKSPGVQECRLELTQGETTVLQGVLRKFGFTPQAAPTGSGNASLLATLMKMVPQNDLGTILQDMTNKLEKQAAGDTLITFLRVVARAEVIEHQQGNKHNTYASEDLLMAVLDASKTEVRQLAEWLEGEIGLVHSWREFREFERQVRNRQYATRDAVIAKKLWEQTPPAKAFEIDRKIVAAAGLVHDQGSRWCPEQHYLTLIPNEYRRADLVSAARKLYEVGTAAAPKDVKTWQAWGVMEKEEKNYPKARELYGEGIKVNPSHPPIWHALAGMEADLGNWPEVKRIHKTMCDKMPSAPQTEQIGFRLKKGTDKP